VATSGLGLRFPRAERIRKRAKYLHIQSQGRKVSTANFLVFTVWSEPQPPRLGITVSKRVGGAVVRARVKRLVREAFRHTKARFSPGLQMVVVAKADAARLDYARAYAEFLEICRRCGARG